MSKKNGNGNGNGMVDAVSRLKGVNNLGIVEFLKEDILRNPIVAEIEERYKKEF